MCNSAAERCRAQLAALISAGVRAAMLEVKMAFAGAANKTRTYRKIQKYAVIVFRNIFESPAQALPL